METKKEKAQCVGKVPQIRGKMVHFPGKNGGKRGKTVKIPNK